MEPLQILLICSSAVAIMATIPQLKQLIAVKSSREFSLQTYCMWSGTQGVSLTYMISLGDPILIVTNIAWVAYYLTMVGLILHYRDPGEEMVYDKVSFIDEGLTEPLPVNIR